jgi:rRNA pseudouridine-1189 N-methylase Emg1 (Nep1/Mra1 family)
MSSLAYVTLEEAKRHLRISEFDECDDQSIDLLIGAASGVVKNYLKTASAYEGERDEDDDYILDSNGEPDIDEDSNTARYVKPEVKHAVLLLIGEWFKNREGDGAQYVHMVLPAPVLALLYPLRDPALA